MLSSLFLQFLGDKKANTPTTETVKKAPTPTGITASSNVAEYIYDSIVLLLLLYPHMYQQNAYIQ